MRTALVLGGTGMLKGCADELRQQGWQVVLPSRRAGSGPGSAALRALGARGHVPQAPVEAEENLPKLVEADWSRPEELAERVRAVLTGSADLLVAWVHASYRVPVLEAVAPLLAPGAPVVEVHDIGDINPREGVRDPILPGHPTQQVVLGFIRHGSSTRWLSHEETSVGVLEAVHRALDGKSASIHQIGEVDTWVVRS